MAMRLAVVFISVVFSLAVHGDAQQDNTKRIQAVLGIAPRHAVASEYDQVEAGMISDCLLEDVKSGKGSGILVKDSTGRLLRSVHNTSGSSAPNQWSFYRNGLEVYRDIDVGGKPGIADQHRWMGVNGIRWGIDKDEDGSIDQWKMISAEEVAVEAFEAVLNADLKRFSVLLATSEEVREMGLGSQMEKTLLASIEEAKSGFRDFSNKQSRVKKDSKFIHFGGTRPSLAPAGANGLERDQVVYDNATAVFETGQDLEQLSLGTMIRIGDAWRLLELPAVIEASQPITNGGLFFPLPELGVASGPLTPEMEKLNSLYDRLEAVEKKLASETDQSKRENLQGERADAMLAIAMANTVPEERSSWIRQLTDVVLQASLSGNYRGGMEKLESVVQSLKKGNAADLSDYIQWSLLNYRYSESAKDDPQAAQATYLKSLEGFVADYPASDVAADALFQLALYAEVNDADRANATKWYNKIVKDFPQSVYAEKAKGAVIRLEGTGKPLRFTGLTMLDEKTLNIHNDAYRGKILLLSFWVSTLPTMKSEIDELKRLGAKYRSNELYVVGACLDDDKEAAQAFMKEHNVTWTNMWEAGGINGSPLARQLGISAPPLSILIDREGKIVDSAVSARDLDREIQKLIKNDE